MSCANQIQEINILSREELINLLKKKVLCETETLMQSLYRGYRLDNKFILAEITAIDMLSLNQLDNDLYILQFFLNNSWETS